MHVPSLQAKAKLPKLILPRFIVDVTKSTSFWGSFKSAVHENETISSINKFNYLNSLLEGPASRAVRGLSLTEANYNYVIEILHEIFGRTQQIISAHMEELLKLPSFSTSEVLTPWYLCTTKSASTFVACLRWALPLINTAVYQFQWLCLSFPMKFVLESLEKRKVLFGKLKNWWT